MLLKIPYVMIWIWNVPWRAWLLSFGGSEWVIDFINGLIHQGIRNLLSFLGGDRN
jgi:hypothetical protein